MSSIVQDIFSNAALRRTLFKARFVLVLALLVPLALHMQPRFLLPGSIVSLFGQLIQTWCFASLVKNRELTARGPYLLCRNPMYIGRYFLILGFVLLLGNGWIVLAYTVVYSLYVVYRVKREETRLARVFGEDYRRYCASVRRFLPGPSRLGDRAVWFFDRKMFLENHAHWNLLGTVTAFALLPVIRAIMMR